MNDWPDRYIHTNFDTAANIDATKLKRAAFIGAASGYFLAHMQSQDFDSVNFAISQGSSVRQMAWAIRRLSLTQNQSCNSWEFKPQYDVAARHSFDRLAPRPLDAVDPRPSMGCIYPPLKYQGGPFFRRAIEPKGPLAVFGYDYFADHAKAADVATPKLFSYEGLWGGGEEYAYEVLNFADGKRNAQEIRDAVSAEYGPVPLEMVVEYLRALEKIGVVAEVK
jgi:hypothetical protein